MKSAAPKKRYGQHFLISPHYARKICDAIPASPDNTVIEIGPGKGALSAFVAKRFPHLIMVEIDPDVVPELRDKLGDGTYTIITSDILAFDFTAQGNASHVAGNLPYYLAASIIHHALLCADHIVSCTFMVQRQVAERIVARPGSRTMGYLSVFCQYFGVARLLFHVPPGAFFPPPDVDSSVFQITLDPTLYRRLERARWEDFFTFVKTVYQNRRKKMSNALSIGGFACAPGILGGLGDVRPEQLSVDQWITLFRGLNTL